MFDHVEQLVVVLLLEK